MWLKSMSYNNTYISHELHTPKEVVYEIIHD